MESGQDVFERVLRDVGAAQHIIAQTDDDELEDLCVLLVRAIAPKEHLDALRHRRILAAAAGMRDVILEVAHAMGDDPLAATTWAFDRSSTILGVRRVAHRPVIASFIQDESALDGLRADVLASVVADMSLVLLSLSQRWVDQPDDHISVARRLANECAARKLAEQMSKGTTRTV